MWPPGNRAVARSRGAPTEPPKPHAFPLDMGFIRHVLGVRPPYSGAGSRNRRSTFPVIRATLLS